MSKKILVLNGPNLNLLGSREKTIYGELNLSQIEKKIEELCSQLKLEVEFYQSNHEGHLIDCIHQNKAKVDAIIINPAGLTHTSVSLRDALKAVELPVIEVHLSNIHAREEFRKNSFISPIALGQISGFGFQSYLLAVQAINEYLLNS